MSLKRLPIKVITSKPIESIERRRIGRGKCAYSWKYGRREKQVLVFNVIFFHDEGSRFQAGQEETCKINV